ncbi:MAG: AraC family transcriptional regulator [Eubacteriales bacterium]|nr:AraC family transcriptional regulator [Eubacteriales bacterium]MDD3881971.1 AraC family transcriptional regulator [Eubacteriales bacterium]MDD4513128.1 AraC family transcriptional regulator [Eubacteriales bacterium]
MKYENLIPTMDYCNYRRNTPDWKIIESVVHFYDVTYVVGGKATYWINGREYSVSEGDIVIIYPGSKRKAIGDPQDQLECFSNNFYLSDNTEGMPPAGVFHIGVRDELIKLCMDIFSSWTHRSEVYLLRTRAQLMLLISELIGLTLPGGRSAPIDPRVREVERFILKNYMHELKVQNMADLVRLHPSYLSSLFHKETGLPIAKYLLFFRLNRAEDFLREGIYSVGDIAKMCGFSDIYYFSKQYKRVKGMSPSEAKRRARLATAKL